MVRTRREPRGWIVLAVLLGGAVVGCAATQSGPIGSAAPASPGVNPRKKLAELTPAEHASLCDWSATMVGGYGTRYYCPGYVYQTYTTQAACVESRSRVISGCAATVADSQACTTVTQEDPCRATSRQSVPECAGRLRGCFTPAAAARSKAP